jgi:hypothetical protein
MARFDVTHASHVGPRFASKRENQDATFASQSAGKLVFALADGVSTSVGAGLAARLAVAEFCRAGLMADSTPVGAMASAKRVLNETLDRLTRASDSELFVLAPDLPPSSVRLLLANTSSRFKHWPVALATTLIGCVVDSIESSENAIAQFVMVGDGQIEILGRDGTVRTLIEVDPDQTRIDFALCPNRHSSKAMEEQGYSELQCRLNPGEVLLTSSDGLLRGRERTISGVLQWAGMHPADWPGENATWAASAIDSVLGIVEKGYPNRRDCADNLSLVAVRMTASEVSNGVQS